MCESLLVLKLRHCRPMYKMLINLSSHYINTLFYNFSIKEKKIKNISDQRRCIRSQYIQKCSDDAASTSNNLVNVV